MKFSGPRRLLPIIFTLAALLFPSRSPAGQAAGSMLLAVPPVAAAVGAKLKMVTLDPLNIGGAGSAILYRGRTFTGPVRVPENSLIGVVKEGRRYLYHPAMGKHVAFSEATNRKAVALFWFDGANDHIVSKSLPRAGAYDTVTVGTKTGLEDKEERTLGTYVTVKRNDPNITITNELNRWVAVKLYGNGGEEVLYLAPKGHYLNSSMIRTLGNVGAVSHPLLDLASTQNRIRVSSASVQEIETFGAVMRGVPYFIHFNIWPTGVGDGWNRDSALMRDVNLLDVMNATIEVVETVVGLIPLECVDALSSLFVNSIQTTLLAIATNGQANIQQGYLMDSAYDVLNGISGCMASALTVGTSELLFNVWDIVVTGDFVVEEFRCLHYMATSSAFAGEIISHPSCEDTAVEERTAYVAAHVTGTPNTRLSYQYSKIYCDGTNSGIVGPYSGQTDAAGHYYAAMEGVFKLDNSRDQVVVRATMNGVSKEVVIPYGRAARGISIIFPEWVDVNF